MATDKRAELLATIQKASKENGSLLAGILKLMSQVALHSS